MPATMTITGIDERTKLLDIGRLTETYPWLEIGILYTATPEGRNRYPSLSWIADIVWAIPDRCALHVCGRVARKQLLERKLIGVTNYVARIQINGAIESSTMQEFCRTYKSHTLITQDTESNRACRFVEMENHALLIDGSGGRGILPTSWSQPATWKDVGFAGGLGHDNLATELPKIASMARGDWWVDMENNIRTDDWFDIEKAKRACEAFTEWRKKA
jgi:hypothetical protein